jgi:hypothetical protein
MSPSSRAGLHRPDFPGGWDTAATMLTRLVSCPVATELLNELIIYA